MPAQIGLEPSYRSGASTRVSRIGVSRAYFSRSRMPAARPNRPRKRARASAAPRLPRYRPQLPTPADQAPSGEEWLHELRYGGERVACSKRGLRVRLERADGEDCTDRFPHLVEAIARLPAKTLLMDGEVIATRTGAGSAKRHASERYLAFDLLYLDGRDLSRRPLEERKQRLAESIQQLPLAGVLQYSEHVLGDGRRVFEHACKLGAVAVVAKRRTAPHRAGPSEDWREIACPTRSGHNPTRATHVVIRGVTISTPGRVLYPTIGFTKRDLVELYADISTWILPHVQGRPLTMVRCEPGVSRPDALRTECQFLRHSSGWHRWVPKSVHRELIAEQQKRGEYLVIQSVSDLLAILNGDIVELHTWNATIGALERPDRIVFDLDPGLGVAWSDVVAAALLLRARLRNRSLESWVKTTGGNGLHVCVPLAPGHSWDACFELSRNVAEALVRAAPASFTTTYGKAARPNKILIDYKRNHRAAVTASALSARARPNGSVSVPMSWEELSAETIPDRWTVVNLRERFRTLARDPWSDYWSCRQSFAAVRSRRSSV
jgi:DNA ligase D-like protein (predicted polymerase)